MDYRKGSAVNVYINTIISIIVVTTTITNELLGKIEKNLLFLGRKIAQPQGNRQGPFTHIFSKGQYSAGPRLLYIHRGGGCAERE